MKKLERKVIIRKPFIIITIIFLILLTIICIIIPFLCRRKYYNVMSRIDKAKMENKGRPEK